MSSFPLTTFILSYERPLYLWATLDSLYQATKSKMQFVLVDSGSRDPLVHKVIDGFSRRGFFQEVVKYENNNKEWAEPFFSTWHEKVGEIFFFVESDVVVQKETTCWAQRMMSVMARDPSLAMLGSKIDKSDFIVPAELEVRIKRALAPEEKQQMKLLSPERNMPDIGPDSVAAPFNPPGRLLALRTKAVRDHLGNVMQWRDVQMHHILRKNGWITGIYGGVVHRHLSLCNYFDYPEYTMEQRDLYMHDGELPKKVVPEDPA